MVRRYYASSLSEVVSYANSFLVAGVTYQGYTGFTGGYNIFKFNGLYAGLISDIYLHVSESVGEIAYVQDVITTGMLPTPQDNPPGLPPDIPPGGGYEPPIVPPVGDIENLYLYDFYFKLPDNSSAGKAGAIAEMLGAWTLQHDIGWRFQYCYVEGDEIIVGMRRDGSITVFIMLAVIIGLIIATIWSKIISYRVYNVGLQKDVVEARDADVKYLTSRILQLVTDGKLTAAEAQALVDTITQHYAQEPLPGEQPPSTSTTIPWLPIAIIGGIALLATRR